ncbi:MAG: hypothetical protein PVI62_15385 [Desulfobacterales bacterium]
MLSKTWRKDRYLEGIIQTSLIVMIPDYWPLRFLYLTSSTLEAHHITPIGLLLESAMKVSF